MALAEVFESFVGPEAPVEFTAYDGSHAGIPGSPVKITVRSPVAVAYLAQAPGGLGLARAYVAGHLDVEGDMYEALARMTKAQSIDMSMAEKLRHAHVDGLGLRHPGQGLVHVAFDVQVPGHVGPGQPETSRGLGQVGHGHRRADRDLHRRSGDPGV